MSPQRQLAKLIKEIEHWGNDTILGNTFDEIKTQIESKSFNMQCEIQEQETGFIKELEVLFEDINNQ